MAQADTGKKLDLSLVSQMEEKVNEIAQANKTVKNMEYFYDFTKMMYTLNYLIQL